jgi:UDP-N-acetylmuramate--alanine ligase
MSEKYHFIGIGGIGMSGLAHMLLKQNISVSGSDIASSHVVDELIKAGAQISIGHHTENVRQGDIIVYTSDIKKDNPEYLAGQKWGSPLWHRSDLLAHLMKDQKPLAVAGTHGKTTTSALLSSVLIEAGWDPTIVVGGIIPQYKCHSKLGKGKYFAFEADESDGSFLKYHSYGAIVTNIDKDHLNNYQDSEQALIEAFKKFMSQVSSAEHLFYCGDDIHLSKLNHGQSYGFTPSCKWQIRNLRQKGFHSFFDLVVGVKCYKEIELGLIGRHNALNAAAVFGLTVTLGVPESDVRNALKTFKGVLRRCEIKGEKNQVLFIDDYAHHPTEIETTLKGIRQAIEEKRMIVVFQPHRYSRTKDCLGTYGNIFDVADKLLVTDIYGSNEEPIAGLHSGLIVDEVQAASSISCDYIERSQLSHRLKLLAAPQDVIVTLGAGDVTKVAAETLTLFSYTNE